jgi:hypothetical protein
MLVNGGRISHDLESFSEGFMLEGGIGRENSYRKQQLFKGYGVSKFL